MTHRYDPFLLARKEALRDLEEDLTVEQHEVAMQAIDVFLDKIDYILQTEDKIVRNHETGQLTVFTDEYDSNS